MIDGEILRIIDGQIERKILERLPKSLVFRVMMEFNPESKAKQHTSILVSRAWYGAAHSAVRRGVWGSTTVNHCATIVRQALIHVPSYYNYIELHLSLMDKYGACSTDQVTSSCDV